MCPDDSNGNYSLPNGYLAVTGQKVLPSNHNPPLEDIGTALSARLSADGRKSWTGDQDANGNKIVGLDDGTNAGDAVNKGQLDEKAGLADDNIFTGENTFSGVNTFTKTQILAKGADVASASALDLGDDGNYFDVTGTTAITSINTVGVGAVVKLHFDGALTLTHHATDLVLPGGANITTAAGDEAEFVEYAAGDWRCTNYQRAGVSPSPPFTTSYESAEQAITAAGSLTLAHGFGMEPKLIQLLLVCKTGENGYSVGDKVFINHSQQSPGDTSQQGVSVVPDATNLNIRFGLATNTFRLFVKNTGGVNVITNANWRLIVRAWA